MVYYPVGGVIREYRIRRELTQEQLCEGICAPATLSKIECGRQAPGRRILEALLERLGVTQPCLLGGADLQRFLLEQEIEQLFCGSDYEKLLEKITEYERLSKETETLERQYILFCKARYGERTGLPAAQIHKLLEDALQCTIQGFAFGQSLENRLYTIRELKIIYKLCCFQYWAAER